MRRFAILGLLLSCQSGPAVTPPAPMMTPPAPAEAAPAPPTAPPAPPAATAPERPLADTPKTTVGGATFMAPAGWTITVRAPATILEAPEAGSRLALVDVPAGDGLGVDAEAAVAAAWAAYQPEARRTLKAANPLADKNGWTQRKAFEYQTSPNERRVVQAIAARAGNAWTVAVIDLDEAVAEKRSGQLGVVFDRLFPKGYTRESFAGKQAHKLDAARIAALGEFVDKARVALGVPGVSIGVVQDGKVVFAGGFGVRALGGNQKVDGDTRYMIASNTKAMTTLLLAKLVEEGKLGWDSQVTQLLPSFKLGDADTTRSVLVKHLVCACTGLPRKDFEWIFEFKNLTSQAALADLGKIQPTSKFGELFQYSNGLAGAGGFVAGHVAFPELELGAAYDRAMQTRVFDPLGMTATTFDFARAQRGNYARAHATDIDGKPAFAVMALNHSVIPLRPAGGAWSNVRDVLKYVQMELAEGVLPSGERYIPAEPLLARRAPQVAIGKNRAYGMGLIIDSTYGTPVVNHGGDLIGHHSDMFWLPEHGVGAVILTNADAGVLIRAPFRRKLVELLFDGQPEADATIAVATKNYFEQIATERKLIVVPADPAEAGKLAARYTSDKLGALTVSRRGATTTFDFGEWKSEVGSRKNPDGSVSFVTTTPSVTGFDFVVGSGGGKRTLTVRDAQHEYVFTER